MAEYISPHSHLAFAGNKHARSSPLNRSQAPPRRWTVQEDRELEKVACEGTSWLSVALTMKRTALDCRVRAKGLGIRLGGQPVDGPTPTAPELGRTPSPPEKAPHPSSKKSQDSVPPPEKNSQENIPLRKPIADHDARDDLSPLPAIQSSDYPTHLTPLSSLGRRLATYVAEVSRKDPYEMWLQPSHPKMDEARKKILQNSESGYTMPSMGGGKHETDLSKRILEVLAQADYWPPGRAVYDRLAEILGVSHHTARHWCLGSKKPSRKALRKFAEHFYVNLLWLETGEGNMAIDSSEVPFLSEYASWAAQHPEMANLLATGADDDTITQEAWNTARLPEMPDGTLLTVAHLKKAVEEKFPEYKTPEGVKAWEEAAGKKIAETQDKVFMEALDTEVEKKEALEKSVKPPKFLPEDNLPEIYGVDMANKPSETAEVEYREGKITGIKILKEEPFLGKTTEEELERLKIDFGRKFPEVFSINEKQRVLNAISEILVAHGMRELASWLSLIREDLGKLR